MVGNGNVAMDLARILASPREVLAATDIAEHALRRARRATGSARSTSSAGAGPAQAAFTNKELKELGELPGVDVIVDPAEAVELDPLSEADVAARPNRTRDRNLELLREFADAAADRGAQADRAALPGLAGGDHRHASASRRSRSSTTSSTRARTARSAPRPTERRTTLPVGLVFRAIGYQGVPLPGIPFDAMRGVIPNDAGRIIDPHTGEPVAGRVRGRMDQARAAGDHRDQQARLPGDGQTASWRPRRRATSTRSEVPAREVLERLLRERRSDFVSYEDWQLIDLLEQERGARQRARRGSSSASVEEMLHALQERKRAAAEEAADS